MRLAEDTSVVPAGHGTIIVEDLAREKGRKQGASRRWMEAIAFREYLRAHSDVAAEYEDLKRQLAATYRFDREAYTDGKASFVGRIVGLANHGLQCPDL